MKSAKGCVFLHSMQNLVLCPWMSNLHVKTQISWFFRSSKIFEDTKTHRILLIHEIRLRMRIFVLNIKPCFMPLNEHFACKITNFETLKPHKILIKYEICLRLHIFCDTYIIMVWAPKYAIYKQPRSLVFCLSKRDEQ